MILVKSLTLNMSYKNMNYGINDIFYNFIKLNFIFIYII